MPVECIISGGQIGADIAGLRAGAALGLETGGWMPQGFRTLEGDKPEYVRLYGVAQMTCRGYPPRTRQNILDSDGTALFFHNPNSPGTALTRRITQELGNPAFRVRIRENGSITTNQTGDFIDWLVDANIQVLNVAGNSLPWIEPIVESFLVRTIRLVNSRANDQSG